MILITGGAGFIGSNFILNWLMDPQAEKIVNLDKLTYAGGVDNIKSILADKRHIFVEGDIGDKALVDHIFSKYLPRAVINFAAESHVDRSIDSPFNFIETNIVGTFNLLECFRRYFIGSPLNVRNEFRFLHVSTDEVYGSLTSNQTAFTESSLYMPNSPYSASKASSDHLVRAWHHTYGIPTLTTNCSNNYGPYQFPEKLIPLIIYKALYGQEIPVYGDGLQIRDWLYVEDHCRALQTVLARGRVGEVYNIGGASERTNLEIVQYVCEILDRLTPRSDGVSYIRQVSYVADRPGHDRRYAINFEKIRRELGWSPAETFSAGLLKTVEWYVGNQKWVSNALKDL